ncbi:hypothetical protein W02_36700 [Nitrospira sp. KM1]|nr:hypothetical protein W02_36700 [Nitrospira sp. KM1]
MVMKRAQRAHLMTRLPPCQRAISFPHWHRRSEEAMFVRISLTLSPALRRMRGEAPLHTSVDLNPSMVRVTHEREQT